MKLTITQPALAAILERGGAAAAKKSPLEILNHVRLIADDGFLSLASSDQDRFAEANAMAEVSEPGGVCVAHDKLKDLVRKHPKTGIVSLTLDGERLVVKCGRSEIKLPTLPVSQFPTWAEQAPVARFTMNGADMARAFGRVRFAASTSDSQWYLQGVLLDYHDGSLHFVATDTHRLAVSGIAAPKGSDECPRAIVPSEGVDAALTVFKDTAEVEITISDKAAGFAADNIRLSARLIDGTYPPYEKIIPERGSPGFSVKRAEFVDCLQRANVLVGDGAFSSIIARPDGDTLRLESRNQGGGEATEELGATIEDGFQPFGFNPKYAADFLATLNVGHLTIEQGDPMGPHLIYSEDAPDFVGVLMPMRVAA